MVSDINEIYDKLKEYYGDRLVCSDLGIVTDDVSYLENVGVLKGKIDHKAFIIKYDSKKYLIFMTLDDGYTEEFMEEIRDLLRKMVENYRDHLGFSRKMSGDVVQHILWDFNHHKISERNLLDSSEYSDILIFHGGMICCPSILARQKAIFVPITSEKTKEKPIKRTKDSEWLVKHDGNYHNEDTNEHEGISYTKKI